MLCARPLLPPSYVQTALDISEDKIVRLVEEGLIPAWNIGTNGARSKELRLLSAGVTWYAATETLIPMDMMDACEYLIPPDAPLDTVSILRTLNCSRDLIRLLICQGELKLAPGAKLRRGRGGFAKLTRSSALEFLKKRIL